MAGDWIKMRTDLYRDPKVSVIADELMDGDGLLAAYVSQHCQRDMSVTRNVMRNVVVGALVSVWGVMRQRGKRNGDNLQCFGITPAVLDDIADVPGFGAAMAAAGWVVESVHGIEFPNFFEENNVDPSERKASAAAERQRKYRERQKSLNRDDQRDVTRDVTVTPREEKRREENIHTDKSVCMPHLDFTGWPTHPSEQVFKDWLQMRKARKAPVTQTVINGLAREISKAVAAGNSVDDCLALCSVKGWQGFKYAWMQRESGDNEQGTVSGAAGGYRRPAHERNREAYNDARARLEREAAAEDLGRMGNPILPQVGA